MTPSVPAIRLRPTGLAEQIVETLAARIHAGDWKLGERIGTEQQLTGEFGVSRTVIREAIARLKADGLVDSRPGAGVFVTRSLLGSPFRIDPASVGTIEEVALIFELRLGVESEAAALAARRSSADQRRTIARAMKAVATADARGGDGVAEDLEFHRAIALAANNRHFEQLGTFLDRYIEQALKLTRSRTELAGRLAEVNAEHERIFEAISARNPDAAREASRHHIGNGISRLSTIAG